MGQLTTKVLKELSVFSSPLVILLPFEYLRHIWLTLVSSFWLLLDQVGFHLVSFTPILLSRLKGHSFYINVGKDSCQRS